MLSRTQHDGLVAQLYSSALGERPWTATLAQVADLFRSSASFIQLSDLAMTNVRAEAHGYSPEFTTRFYASEVYARDPRMPHFLRVRPGSVYYDHSLYDVEAMSRDPRVRESVEILGVQYQLGAVLRTSTDTHAALTILSTTKEGHATESAIRDFRRLMPHFEQAVALGHAVEHKAATRIALIDALARKADGVIMLGCSSVPSFMNDAADAILAARDGLAWQDGAFVTCRAGETRRLRQLIADAIAVSASERPGGQMLVTRPSGIRPFVLRVMPAPPTDSFMAAQSVACLIHIHDLGAVGLPSKASLGAVFGLTEREADLAVELVRCARLGDAAARAGMALNTARNHLQSIFRKSGASTQAEAVQLFSRLF